MTHKPPDCSLSSRAAAARRAPLAHRGRRGEPYPYISGPKSLTAFRRTEREVREDGQRPIIAGRFIMATRFRTAQGIEKFFIAHVSNTEGMETCDRYVRIRALDETTAVAKFIRDELGNDDEDDYDALCDNVDEYDGMYFIEGLGIEIDFIYPDQLKTIR